MMSRMNLVATLVAILAVVGTAEQGNLRTRELVNNQEVSYRLLGISATRSAACDQNYLN